MILTQVIAYLVATFDAASTFPVYDGPVPAAVNQASFVLVGSAGDEDDDGAVVERPLSDLGPGTWRDETGEIVCAVWSWSGGDDLSARRAAALDTANACIAAVEADRSLGGLLVAPRMAEVLELRYRPRQTDSGVIVRVTFTVTYQHLAT